MEYISDLERLYSVTQEPYSRTRMELMQAEELGHDVSSLHAKLQPLGPSGDDDATIEAIYEAIPQQPAKGWPYTEDSALDAILSALPAAPETTPALSDNAFGSRLRGAWHGRVVGNMLGKPFEGVWRRIPIRAYLEKLGEYPLRDYVPIPEPLFADLDAAGFVGQEMMPYRALSRGRISGGIRDDDVDWTILNLTLVEDFGIDFTSYQIAQTWLFRLPIYQTATAERAAYSNLVRGVPLDETGSFQNPFREWIGALIRADLFAYISPGRPRRAATTAYRDAVLSHRANGIYGEMWAAALIASAFVAETPEASVRESLRHIPANSRLAIEVGTVLDDWAAGRSWDEVMEALDARHARTYWVHTLNNAGALTAGILFGGGDFTDTVGLTVQAGLDTDSIGATAGSWAGAFVGYEAIPDHWLAPLEGRTRSAVFGFGDVRIDDLVERTILLENKYR